MEWEYRVQMLILPGYDDRVTARIPPVLPSATALEASRLQNLHQQWRPLDIANTLDATSGRGPKVRG